MKLENTSHDEYVGMKLENYIHEKRLNTNKSYVPKLDAVCAKMETMIVQLKQLCVYVCVYVCSKCVG